MLATGRLGRLISAQKDPSRRSKPHASAATRGEMLDSNNVNLWHSQNQRFFLVGTQKEYTGIHLWILNHGLFIKILSSVHVEALILYAPLTRWLKCCFVVDQVLRLWLPHIERLPHDGPWFLCRILSRWLISEQRVGCYSPNFMA